MKPDAYIPKDKKNEKQNLDDPDALFKLLSGRFKIKEKKNEQRT